MNKTIGVVLCGGNASRLPNKPLLPLKDGRPMVVGAVDYLHELEVDSVVASVGDNPILENYFKTGELFFKVDNIYKDNREGIIPALKGIAEHYDDSDNFLIVVCDNSYENIRDGFTIRYTGNAALVCYMESNYKEGLDGCNSAGDWLYRGDAKIKYNLATPWNLPVGNIKSTIATTVLELFNYTAVSPIIAEKPEQWKDLGTEDLYVEYLASNKKIIKHEPKELITKQLKFFNSFQKLTPNVSNVESDRYTYDFIEGKHPKNGYEVQRAYNLLKDNYGIQAIEEFILYMQGISTSAYVLEILSTWESMKPDLNWTPVCHGDFTLSNIIMSDGVPVFIDPGDDRGLSCIEQDEAKLLQSTLLYWEDIKFDNMDNSHVLANPFDINRNHIVLLYCHWLRLLKHPEKHNASIIKFAQLIEPILGEICRRSIGLESIIKEVWVDLDGVLIDSLGAVLQAYKQVIENEYLYAKIKTSILSGGGWQQIKAILIAEGITNTIDVRRAKDKILQKQTLKINWTLYKILKHFVSSRIPVKIVTAGSGKMLPPDIDLPIIAEYNKTEASQVAGIYLIDDSQANVDRFNSVGAIATLYKPFGDK